MGMVEVGIHDSVNDRWVFTKLQCTNLQLLTLRLAQEIWSGPYMFDVHRLDKRDWFHVLRLKSERRFSTPHCLRKLGHAVHDNEPVQHITFVQRRSKQPGTSQGTSTATKAHDAQTGNLRAAACTMPNLNKTRILLLWHAVQP